MSLYRRILRPWPRTTRFRLSEAILDGLRGILEGLQKVLEGHRPTSAIHWDGASFWQWCEKHGCFEKMD